MDNLNGTDKLNIVIETSLQLIPYVGGALATAYFGTKQAKQFIRIERFYRELAQDLEQVKEHITSIDDQYVDGLIALIEKVNIIVENEHSAAKTEYLKKYMKCLLKNPVTNANYDAKKVYIDILGNMTELECELMAFLYKSKPSAIEVGAIQKSDVNQYAIVGTVSRLKTYGFLITSQVSFSIGSAKNDNMLKEQVSISDYGNGFVEFCIV